MYEEHVITPTLLPTPCNFINQVIWKFFKASTRIYNIAARLTNCNQISSLQTIPSAMQTYKNCSEVCPVYMECAEALNSSRTLKITRYSSQYHKCLQCSWTLQIPVHEFWYWKPSAKRNFTTYSCPGGHLPAPLLTFKTLKITQPYKS